MERRDKSMITLLQLDYFRKLAATEHITKTAKELYISQTALSSMIIGLEKELGTPLFDRSNRAIHLNEAGKTYLKYVNEVFRSLENGKSALADLKTPTKRTSALRWEPRRFGCRCCAASTVLFRNTA